MSVGELQSPASSLATALSTAFHSLEVRSHLRSSRRTMVQVRWSLGALRSAASWSLAPVASEKLRLGLYQRGAGSPGRTPVSAASTGVLHCERRR